jgi:DNA-binding response OmpR family regulator
MFAPARILIVEDNRDTAFGLLLNMEHEGFMATAVHSAHEGLQQLESWKPDLVILDLRLPDVDGFAFLQKMRESRNRTPVLILSAVTDIEARVRIFDLGASDYLAKPFAVPELVARIKVRLATFAQRAANSSILLHRGFWEVEANGDRVRLTPKEFRILEVLMLHRGVPQSRKRLLELVWNVRVAIMTKRVDVHVSNLRSKLRHLGLAERIVTITNQGVLWVEHAPAVPPRRP